MMSRSAFLRVVAASLFALSVLPLLAADDKAQEAIVGKVGNGKITLTFKGDEKKHTHDVAKDAKITLDGKAAKLDELKEGFPVHDRRQVCRHHDPCHVEIQVNDQ